MTQHDIIHYIFNILSTYHTLNLTYTLNSTHPRLLMINILCASVCYPSQVLLEKLAGPPLASLSEPSLASTLCRAVVSEPFLEALAALRYHRHAAAPDLNTSHNSEENTPEEGLRQAPSGGVGAGVKGGVSTGRLDQLLQSLTWRFVQSLPGPSHTTLQSLHNATHHIHPNSTS